MKNLSIIINSVLAIAVATLFVLHFSSNKTPSTSMSSDTETSVGGTKVAYVNIDSILLKYTLAIELNEALTKKGTNMKARLDKEMSEFEKEYQVFLDKAQRGIYLTQQRQDDAQQALGMRQQELQQLEREYTNQLGMEQQKMNTQLFDSINSYINTYNTPEQFQVIFGHSLGGNILYGSPDVDITGEILKGLNEIYTGK